MKDKSPRKPSSPISLPEDARVVSSLDELESGTFGTLYVDPPWRYGNKGTRAAAANHYKMLSVDELASWPVSRLAAENAHLHLWTTNAFIFEAEKLMRKWEFRQTSIFVWVKPQMGMGNFWRVSHEFLLTGVRGKCPFRAKGLRSWQEFKRGKHSAKPEEVRKMIELASPGPYLELFGRKPIRRPDTALRTGHMGLCCK